MAGVLLVAVLVLGSIWVGETSNTPLVREVEVEYISEPLTSKIEHNGEYIGKTPISRTMRCVFDPGNYGDIVIDGDRYHSPKIDGLSEHEIVATPESGEVQRKRLKADAICRGNHFKIIFDTDVRIMPDKKQIDLNIKNSN